MDQLNSPGIPSWAQKEWPSPSGRPQVAHHALATESTLELRGQSCFLIEFVICMMTSVIEF